MAMAKPMPALLFLTLALFAASRTATAAMSCSDAVNAMIPCGPFLIGAGGPNPTAECCQSAQALNKMSTTPAARRALCTCLTSTGPSFGVVPARAKRLPPYCKLNLNIPVSPNVNCSAVK